MDAFIKKERWQEFKKDYVDYGFTLAVNPNYYIKPIDKNLLLIISRRNRRLKSLTPIGESPFMEVQKEYYEDIYLKGFIEYKKNRFD